MRLNYKSKTRITRKLNQDCLEHFFGCIRQKNGTHDHPNALNFKYRMNKLILGKDVVLTVEKPNTNSDDLDCLSNNSMMKQA